MLNTTTKRIEGLWGKRDKGNYTIKTYIGSNDTIYIDVVDNATGVIFRDLVLDLKYNKIFDKNDITGELSVADF